MHLQLQLASFHVCKCMPRVHIKRASCSHVHRAPAAEKRLPLHQGLAEGDAVEFELELVDFDRAPNWEAMGADAKIARAEALKEQGNRVFKAGAALFKHAAQKWTKAIQLVDHAFDIDTADQVLPALLPDPGHPCWEYACMSCLIFSCQCCRCIRLGQELASLSPQQVGAPAETQAAIQSTSFSSPAGW